jgi:outer membrane lipoprotein SlyB
MKKLTAGEMTGEILGTVVAGAVGGFLGYLFRGTDGAIVSAILVAGFYIFNSPLGKVELFKKRSNQ